MDAAAVSIKSMEDRAHATFERISIQAAMVTSGHEQVIESLHATSSSNISDMQDVLSQVLNQTVVKHDIWRTTTEAVTATFAILNDRRANETEDEI
jgi:hypothetical protein